jgi:DHA1 family inner membrane transport protein
MLGREGTGRSNGTDEALAPLTSMSVACGAALVTAITPMLFAKMVDEGRMLTAQIGQAATAELIGVAVTTGIAGAFLGVDRLRVKVAIAAFVFALANLASAYVDYPGILVTRGLAGVCEGVFVWQLMQIFARSARPGRLQGMYLAVEGTLGLMLSALYSAVIIPLTGASGGFIALSVVSVALLATCAGLPRSLPALPAAGIANLPTRRALVGLSGAFLSFAGILAIWVHLPSLALQQHQPGATVGLAISLALMCEVVGGLTAATIDSRLPARPLLLTCWVVLAIMPFIWTMSIPPWLFVTFGAVFGFVWMFHLPYSVSYIVELDPTRRSLPFLPTAQPLGAGAGPILASLAVVGTDVRGALLVGTALLIAAVLPVFSETLVRRRGAKVGPAVPATAGT